MIDRRHALTAGVLGGLALAGCRSSPDDPSSDRQSSSTTSGRTAATTSAATSGVLVVYYSRAGENYWYGDRRDLDVGNTEVLARMIEERIDCDVHRLEPVEPYPEAYDPTVDRNSREQEADARPELAGDLPDLSGYGTVLLGSPVWGSRAPMLMSTFVEAVDLAGVRVLPFVTYAVSGMSGIDADYRRALPDSEVVDGLAVRGEEVRDARADLDAWLEANGLL